MPSPFPGMDPYLERPSRWHPFHVLLIGKLIEAVDAVLPEPYYVSPEARAVLAVTGDALLVGIPDAAVLHPLRGDLIAGRSTGTLARGVDVLVPQPETELQRYLEVREAGTEELVTVIEVLSPVNKDPGKGREQYLEKRSVVLGTLTNLIEVDLLRAGVRMPMSGAPEEFDYGLLISRRRTRPHAQLLHFSLREPIPTLPLPLRLPHEETEVDLPRAFTEAFDLGRYGNRINYHQPAIPPLSPDNELWAGALLREKGLR